VGEIAVKRIVHPVRADWQRKVESVGLAWHSAKGAYWNEAAYYSFTMDEILKLEHATNTLHGMCLEAAQHIIDRHLFERLRIPAHVVPLIIASWEQEPPSLYGRFDLAYDGVGAPKLLEYNADTPTSLVEASLAQWFWLQDVFPNSDQFNSLHERLIEQWALLKDYLQGERLHFAGMDDIEDGMTLAYLRDTAEQAGLACESLTIPQIGLTSDGFFTDVDDRVIESIFKLYPWEWIVHEDEAFVRAVLDRGTSMQWIEPIWKMLLSNKGILAVLWELFPESPYLLPASLDVADTITWDAYVRKPLLSREGANVTVTMFDQTLMESQGNYGDDGYVYQGLATIPNMDGVHPVIGAWVIGQEAAGIGIRESKRLITDNMSQFVPHVIHG
jgi:glutathionylspermidine synthase